MSDDDSLPSDEPQLPLKDLRVLLTRPKLQAVKLADSIKALGGIVLELPLLEIEALVDKPSIERVKTQVMALDQYDAALFISTNAASLGMEWISQYWPQLPVGLEAYAVGPSTAEILQQFPWPVHFSSIGVTSEHLLALPGLQEVSNKRIALFRGQGGRELLAETLRERGARVDYIELYQRRVPIYDSDETVALLQNEHVKIVVLTSMQILESFLRLLGLRDGNSGLRQESRDNPDTALLSLTRTLSLIVPSTRVSEVAKAAGFKRVIEASGADDKSILESLIRCNAQVEEM